MLAVVLITAFIALVFSFTNGMNDAANCIASVVATKALPPKVAVGWAAFWIFMALFIFDTTVAATMGEGIVDKEKIDVYVILAALLGSVLWIFICTKVGLPISASHALIGGLIGPVWFRYGAAHLIGSGIFKVVSFIVISPVLGMVMGFFLNCLFMLIFRRARARRVDKAFRRMQLVSSAAFSLGFGGNDGQKTMGIIAILFASAFAADPSNPVLQLLYGNGAEAARAAGYTGFFVPGWLKYTCYGLIALGTVTGGWSVIRTLGDGLSKLYPTQGFCAEASGAITLILTAVLGIPVSTTHTITGSIIGTGLTRGFKTVRWITAKNIVVAWFLTIPAVIVVSGVIYVIMYKWMGIGV
ncbi:MAG: inorganic phosphate transporter [Bacteroidales bacterium]|nr:inorganic phosphate transporter [Bacteroidales bacterium]